MKAKFLIIVSLFGLQPILFGSSSGASPFSNRKKTISEDRSNGFDAAKREKKKLDYSSKNFKSSAHGDFLDQTDAEQLNEEAETPLRKGSKRISEYTEVTPKNSISESDEASKPTSVSKNRADAQKKAKYSAGEGWRKTSSKRSYKRNTSDVKEISAEEASAKQEYRSAISDNRKDSRRSNEKKRTSKKSDRPKHSSEFSEKIGATSVSEQKSRPLSASEIKALKAEIRWDEPLPLSPAIHAGTLKNGMRYYIYPKKGDCDAVSLRLLVNAGALMETDAEDGLAHFTEHMVFNGSKHFKPGELIPYFQENGMSFGGDTNAFTYYMHTCYKLDVPRNDEASVQKALTVLNDMGFEALFLQKEIDREHGVIFEEMRNRQVDSIRTWEAVSRFMFPQSLLSKRFLIGTKETLDAMKTADFFRFYKKWYTPNRMSLIIAGPTEVQKTVRLIEKTMTQTAEKPTQDPDIGTFPPPPNGLAVKVVNDPELSNTYVALTAVQPFRGSETVTLRDQYREGIWALIGIILQERLEELRKTAPVTDAFFDWENNFRKFETCECVFLCDSKDADEAVRLCERLVRSVTLFGFSKSELDYAKSVVKNRLQSDIVKEQSASARNLADGAVDDLMKQGSVFSATQRQEWFRKLAPTVTTDDCLALWKELWKDGGYLYVGGNLGLKITETHVKDVFLRSQKEKLSQPEPFETIEFQSPFSTHKVPKLSYYRYHPDLGTETFTLGNGIRITLKHTNFENNTILIHVGVGCGLMDFKQTPYPGLPQLLSAAFVSGGLQQGSQTALNRCFVGKNIGLDFDVDEDCYAFKCRTDRENLKTQLELIGAYLLEPGYRTEGEEQFCKLLPGRYENFAHKPNGVIMSAVQEFLSGGDTRYFFPPREILEKRNFVEAASMLKPVFEKQYMEITVVGDFDRDALMRQLFATFGQLPFREKKKRIPQDAGNDFWPKPQTKVFPFASGIDKAVAFVVWPIRPSEAPNETAKIDVLCSILQNRLVENIREKNANTYAPFASSYITETIGRGCIRAFVTTASDKLEGVGEQIVQLADDMAQNGITKEELDRAVKPLISSLGKNRVTNDFWMEWLKNAQARPEKLKWRLADEVRYKKIKIKDIQSLAKRYLQRSSAICMLVKPTLEQKEEAAKTSENGKER